MLWKKVGYIDAQKFVCHQLPATFSSLINVTTHIESNRRRRRGECQSNSAIKKI